MSRHLLETVVRRESIVDLLRDGVTPKRDIIDGTNNSRSTVDRAVADLREHDLVVRRPEGYETTAGGVVALETVRQYIRDSETVSQVAPALRPLWKETPLDIAVLRNAEVRQRTDDGVERLQPRVDTALRSAARVRGWLPAVTAVSQLETLHDRVVAGRDTELVTHPDTAHALERSYPGWVREVTETEQPVVSVGSVPEYSLFVIEETDSERVLIVVHDEGTIHAVIRNTATAAVQWAERQFDGYRQPAVRLGAFVDELPSAESFSPTPGVGPCVTTPTARADAEPGGEASSVLLGGGYAVNGGRMRTPAFGTEGSCAVTLWFERDGFDTDWETLVKWDYLTVGYRRGNLFGHVFDPDEEVIRARTDVPAAGFDDGRWHHLACAYDEATASLYLDGTLADETSDDYPLEIEPLGACLGYLYRHRDTGVHTPEYEGRLRAVRFYDERLPESVIGDQYREGIPHNRLHV